MTDCVRTRAPSLARLDSIGPRWSPGRKRARRSPTRCACLRCSHLRSPSDAKYRSATTLCTIDPLARTVVAGGGSVVASHVWLVAWLRHREAMILQVPPVSNYAALLLLKASPWGEYALAVATALFFDEFRQCHPVPVLGGRTVGVVFLEIRPK
jgi:hypothetical protein